MNLTGKLLTTGTVKHLSVVLRHTQENIAHMETSPLEVTASSALMTFEQRMVLFIVSHPLSHGNMGTERSRFLPKKYPFSVAYEMP